jgi:LytS/YehU family sensor histidine kinase
MIAGFFMAIKLLKYWYENHRIRLELEAQNKDSELALLRNQINPHFLFNTLNNIDTLISDNQEEASDAIMRLSEIMRYMLYDSNTRFVPLQKEISYLESYIALQKIRLKDPDFVKFNVQGNDRNRRIAPMLLIPFVENAFKHGAKDSSARGVFVGITAGYDFLDFVVENDINSSENSSRDITKGIGLKNVTRRLDLIYKDQYQLETTTENNIFRVHLRIIFNENQLHSR